MNKQTFLDDLDREQLFQSLHLIERFLQKGQSTLGTDVLPSNESIQLKVSQQLGYEAGEFADIQLGNNQEVEIVTNLIGLTGEHGVLPSHYTELVLQRLKNNDPTFKDFLDIFNHRLLSLFYRTWQSYQPHVQYQKVAAKQPSAWHQILVSLTGDKGPRSLYFGGYFSQAVRSRGAVQACLESLAGCTVIIRDFKGQWMNLQPQEQTRLCSTRLQEGQFAQLGNGASLGKRAWNMNAGFQVEFVADCLTQVQGLLPQGKKIDAIKTTCRALLGETLAIEWLLTTQYQYLPRVQLNKTQSQLAMGCVIAPHESSKKRTITIRV